MVEIVDVPSPVPPDDRDAWYAPAVRAQYEVESGVIGVLLLTVFFQPIELKLLLMFTLYLNSVFFCGLLITTVNLRVYLF